MGRPFISLTLSIFQKAFEIEDLKTQNLEFIFNLLNFDLKDGWR